MATNYLLKLGTVGFTLDDLPEELPLAGEQTIAVRKFPGGRVHIQAFGSFNNEITWQGDFFGGNAFQRAQAIDKLRISGNVVLMQLGTIAKYVIITKFTIRYRNDSQVGYEITLQPSGTTLQSASVGSTPVKSPSPPPTAKPTTKAPPKPPPKRSYVIRKGDTLWALAVKYYGRGTEWTKIQKANPGIVPTKLRIGSTIVIPY